MQDKPLPQTEPSEPGALQPTTRPKVRDVADFHLRWREFRPIARHIGRNPALSDEEADTLGWMIDLMDRIGPQDVESGGT